MNEFDGPATKAEIKKIGATMADLSRLSGVPYNSINHYCQGYRNPGPKNQKLIEAAVSAMQKATGTPEKPEDTEEDLKKFLKGLDVVRDHG